MIKQNITKDIEIENRLTLTRGERGGDYRGKGQRVCRNNYKGHMDNNKGGGNRGGRWGWVGQRGMVGGKWRQLCLNNKKLI